MRILIALSILILLGSIASAQSTYDPRNWLGQIQQGLSDLADFFTQDQDVCQVIADTNISFPAPAINHKTFLTDYNYDGYLDNGVYYWKVKCRRGSSWSYWSDIRNFTHNTANSSVYFDWTVNTG